MDVRNIFAGSNKDLCSDFFLLMLRAEEPIGHFEKTKLSLLQALHFPKNAYVISSIVIPNHGYHAGTTRKKMEKKIVDFYTM